MTSKKDSKGNSTGSLTALKIGSRVRCTDDGIEGRIAWANAVSVKIRWDDGEQVTWRRDSLADRPIEILQAVEEEEAGAASAESAEEKQGDSVELPREEESQSIPAAEGATAGSEQQATATSVPEFEAVAAELSPPTPEPAEAQATPTTPDATADQPATSKQRRKAPAAPKDKKVSALDAAARVLAEAGQPLNCQEMIVAMAEKGYWSSPGGKTPAATLYSAILREITTKGDTSRFVKTERGKFARTSVA